MLCAKWIFFYMYLLIFWTMKLEKIIFLLYRWVKISLRQDADIYQYHIPLKIKIMALGCNFITSSSCEISPSLFNIQGVVIYNSHQWPVPLGFPETSWEMMNVSCHYRSSQQNCWFNQHFRLFRGMSVYGIWVLCSISHYRPQLLSCLESGNYFFQSLSVSSLLLTLAFL